MITCWICLKKCSVLKQYIQLGSPGVRQIVSTFYIFSASCYLGWFNWFLGDYFHFWVIYFWVIISASYYHVILGDFFNIYTGWFINISQFYFRNHRIITHPCTYYSIKRTYYAKKRTQERTWQKKINTKKSQKSKTWMFSLFLDRIVWHKEHEINI